MKRIFPVPLLLLLELLYFNISQSVILPGPCPIPPRPSTSLDELHNTSVSFLKLLVPLDDKQDNIFTDGWDFDSPTCDTLLVDIEPSLGKLTFKMEKAYSHCNLISGNLSLAANSRTYVMVYRLGKMKRNGILLPPSTACLVDAVFERNVYIWSLNRTELTIIWTCDQFFFSNAHDEGVLILVDQLFATVDLNIILETWLNFTKLRVRDFSIKRNHYCQPYMNCFTYKCPQFGPKYVVVLVAVIVMIVLIAFFQRFLSGKSRKCNPSNKMSQVTPDHIVM